MVAKKLWSSVQMILGVDRCIYTIGRITSMWSDKNNLVKNVVHTAILWALWLVRNSSFFNHDIWLGLQVIWRKAAYNLAQWSILSSGRDREEILDMGKAMEHLAQAPPQLSWDPG